MPVTKLDLIIEAAAQSGRNQNACRLVIEHMMDVIVKAGAPVELRGFGTFYRRERKPRPARNPMTGEVVQLPHRTVLLWRASPEIRHVVAQSRGV